MIVRYCDIMILLWYSALWYCDKHMIWTSMETFWYNPCESEIQRKDRASVKGLFSLSAKGLFSLSAKGLLSLSAIDARVSLQKPKIDKGRVVILTCRDTNPYHIQIVVNLHIQWMFTNLRYTNSKFHIKTGIKNWKTLQEAQRTQGLCR